MRIDNPTKEHLDCLYDNLNNHIETSFERKWIKYIDLGPKVIRLISFSAEFTPHVQKQLDFSLTDHCENYDATLIIWNEKDIDRLPPKLSSDYDPKVNLKLRVEALVRGRGKKDVCLNIYDHSVSQHDPVIDINATSGLVNAFRKQTNTWYYGVKNLDPEEFIKHGHIFVQVFNRILKTPSVSLVHGALVGLNNNGILLCARGQRGKSTLAVLSMLKGFDYVSDDYLILEREGNDLYSYPIYSIITLSPVMYNNLYDDLEGVRFVSNNARKDKYVINISNYHNQFKKKYPVKVCIFPEITDDEKPSIVLCSRNEKGRAITHLIHSTISQMRDDHDTKTIQKLIDMVKQFDFYKINLCRDIYANVECLKEFTELLNKKESKNDELCIK